MDARPKSASKSEDSRDPLPPRDKLHGGKAAKQERPLSGGSPHSIGLQLLQAIGGGGHTAGGGGGGGGGCVTKFGMGEQADPDQTLLGSESDERFILLAQQCGS